ncbi:MAG: phosphoribosyl-ATP diphosphatase [Gammaproteobacteria bacterium AqS3]|nr:phosphoribosyl-ATP diphosphatase [Gammaproteobacteria bacterium AqS3]
MSEPAGVLSQLDETLAARREAEPDESYVASLYAGGSEAILAKVAEEAEEFAEALLALAEADEPERRSALIHEAADLWFHSLVGLHHLGLQSGDILAELGRRQGTSGHREKAARSGSP